jgi:outer membrane protein assembly factor BamB
MKSHYFLSIIMLLVIKAAGQIPLPEVSFREKIFGRSFQTNKDINGIEHQFKDYVQNVSADTTSGLITLQILKTKNDRKWLTDDGSFAVYDPAIKKLRWTTGINYQLGGAFQLNGLIIKTIPYEGRYILDLKSGDPLWETKNMNPLYYNDPMNLIGLTYSSSKSKESANTLIAIDLTSGKEIWTRSLHRDEEWTDDLKLNDSVIAIVTSGLHTINLNNGTGWDYDFVTNGKGKVKNIVSNIVFNNSKLYIASKEKLICLDEAGKAIWSIALPTDLMSKSHLFIKNKILYLVNRGMVNPGPEQMAYGKPFLAAYQLEDGLQKFYTPTITKEFINGLVIQGQFISLIFGKSIMKYSLQDGQLSAQESYDLKKTGSFRYFVGDLRFPDGQKFYSLRPDSTYQNLLSDSTKQYIVTTAQKILKLNNQLKIEEELSYKDLYFHYGSAGKRKFLGNGANVYNTLILDERNKAIAEIEASYGAKLIGKTLFDSNESKFIEIDLSGVIQN